MDNNNNYIATNTASALSTGDIVYNTLDNTIGVYKDYTDSILNIDTNGITTAASNYYSNVSSYTTTCYSYDTIPVSTIFSVLTEEETKTLLEIIHSRLDSGEFRKILKNVVQNSVFSEEFLLEYAEYLDKDVVMIHHGRLIKSGQYPALAVLYELQ